MIFVEVLKYQNKVFAVTNDGLIDSPTLKMLDIGFSIYTLLVKWNWKIINLTLSPF